MADSESETPSSYSSLIVTTAPIRLVSEICARDRRMDGQTTWTITIAAQHAGGTANKLTDEQGTPVGLSRAPIQLQTYKSNYVKVDGKPSTAMPPPVPTVRFMHVWRIKDFPPVLPPLPFPSSFVLFPPLSPSLPPISHPLILSCLEDRGCGKR